MDLRNCAIIGSRLRKNWSSKEVIYHYLHVAVLSKSTVFTVPWRGEGTEESLKNNEVLWISCMHASSLPLLSCPLHAAEPPAAVSGSVPGQWGLSSAAFNPFADRCQIIFLQESQKTLFLRFAEFFRVFFSETCVLDASVYFHHKASST